MRTLALLLLPCLPLAAQASWTQLYPSQSPPFRAGATWVSHEASGSLSMIYGTDAATGNPATQAWRFQGGTWTLQPGTLPPVRMGASLGYDAAHAQAVMFGGWSQNTGLDLDETWLWNGSSWTQGNPLLRPSARTGAAMAFDHRRGVLVLFGGLVNGTGLNDTWEWNGTSWQPRTCRVLPLRARTRTWHLIR